MGFKFHLLINSEILRLYTKLYFWAINDRNDLD
jgi:hypothetical protein